MFVGHLAAGFAAKRIEPKISLGTGILASLLPDLLWGVFLTAGIEHVHIKSGMGAANYFDAYDIALSHSLLMDIVWAASVAALYFAWRRRLKGAVLLSALVLSHWVLDFLSHRPDMPLSPGAHGKFGLGLWNSVPATVVVEGGLWLVALILYVRATRPQNWVGMLVFWPVVALLTLAWYNNIAGPPPPDPRTAGIMSLIFFSLVVLWAFWMNRLRLARAPEDSGRPNAGSWRQ